MFVGRKKELEILSGLLEKKVSSLVAITGMRRIGKSSLVEEFAKRNYQYFYQFSGLAPRSDLQNEDQLKNFSEQLSKNFNLPTLNLRNWTEAFSILANQVADRKCLVLLDELSWIASKDKDFVGKLKIVWDTQLKKNDNLMLVLCGSVSSWIQDNIINQADFMGRISRSIHLEPLSLTECNLFWPESLRKNISSFEKCKILSVTGGVPRYLEEVIFEKSAEDNIKNLCFRNNSLLVEEFEKIFNDIFDKRANTYSELVRIVSSGHKSFKEICKELNVPQNGTISEYLRDLLTSGFIARDFKWSLSGKQSKLSHYRLKDNYLRFYLHYIEPKLSIIRQNLYDEVELEASSFWDSIMGLQFDNLILNNLPEIIREIGVSPNNIISCSPYFQNKTSKTKAVQIDLLIHTRNNIIYVCEFKFRKKIKSNVISEVQEKIKKLNAPSSCSVRPILIYEGEASSELIRDGYFVKMIKFGDLLEGRINENHIN